MRAIWMAGLGVLAVVVLAVSAPVEAAPSTVPAPAAFVADLYRAYLKHWSDPPAGPAETVAAKQDARRFERIWLTARLRAKFSDDMDADDPDPLLLVQEPGDDWAASLQAKLLRRTPARAAVLVTFPNPDPEWADDQVLAHLVRSGATWRLDAVTASPRDIADRKRNNRPSTIDFSAWDYQKTAASLQSWTAVSHGGDAWSFAEVATCRFRERMEGRAPTEPQPFVDDTVFDIARIRPDTFEVQNGYMTFHCVGGEACTTATRTGDHAQAPYATSGLSIVFHRGRGPDVVGAVKHLAALCRKG
jgi:hypothetical protein